MAPHLKRMSNPSDITDLLQRWRDGDRDAENDLFALVLPNLRRLAHYFMKGERKGHTLQATELVNQVYFKLVAAKDRDWRSRKHFFAIAARAMRRYLIDYARGRPRNEFVGLADLEDMLPANSVKVDMALMVDGLLDQLSETKPDWCTVVELKYIGEGWAVPYRTLVPDFQTKSLFPLEEFFKTAKSLAQERIRQNDDL